MAKAPISYEQFKAAVQDVYEYICARNVQERSKHAETDNQDSALIAAETLIGLGGYDLADSDAFGAEMSQTVQSLLASAIMLQPDMIDNWTDKDML